MLELHCAPAWRVCQEEEVRRARRAICRRVSAARAHPNPGRQAAGRPSHGPKAVSVAGQLKPTTCGRGVGTAHHSSYHVGANRGGQSPPYGQMVGRAHPTASLIVAEPIRKRCPMPIFEHKDELLLLEDPAQRKRAAEVVGLRMQPKKRWVQGCAMFIGMMVTVYATAWLRDKILPGASPLGIAVHVALAMPVGAGIVGWSCACAERPPNGNCGSTCERRASWFVSIAATTCVGR